MLGRYDRALRARQPVGRLTLLQQAIAAIRRNNGTLFYVPQNFSGAWTDSAGTDPVNEVADVIGRMTDRTGGTGVATQATTANKPVVGRWLLNRLTWSNDLTNAAWNPFVGFVRTLEAGAGPNGAVATKITATSTPAAPVRAGFVATSTAHTYAYVYKPGTFNPSGSLIRNDTTSTGLPSTATSVSLGGGWVLICCSSSSGITVGNSLRIYFGATSTIAEGLTYWIASAGIFDGVLTAQQIVDAGGIPLTTAAPAWSATGNYHINFNGSSNSLTTNITTGNEGWVCAGVTFGGADSVIETVFHSGAQGAAKRGVWIARVGSISTNTLWCGVSDGATRAVANQTAIPLKSGQVVVEAGWTAANVFASVNGVQGTTVTRSGDATPPLNLATIGVTAGGSYLNGPMTAQVICPDLPSASDRAIIRKWIGSLQGQTL